MAAISLVPKNGAVVVGAWAANFASFDIDTTQSVEDVTPYGANVDAVHVGSGTPSIDVNIGAFALAHATSTPPTMGSMSAVGGATGASCTFTLDTGVTEAGSFVAKSIRISHARMRAAVPIALAMSNAGDITETWAVS